jgi:hypothetical protein
MKNKQYIKKTVSVIKKECRLRTTEELELDKKKKADRLIQINLEADKMKGEK